MTETPAVGAAPGGWPLLGHTPALLRRPLEFLESLPEYDKVVRIRTGPTKILVICDAFRRALLSDYAQTMTEQAARGFGPAGLNRLPTASNRHYRQAYLRLHDAIARIISEHETNAADSQDILSRILAVHDGGVSPHDGRAVMFSTADVFDQVLTLLLGGADTASNAIAWALHLLADHPDAEARLQAEVDRVLQGRPPGFDDLPNLPFTEHVVNEALRLYPPGWFLTRQTTRPYHLGDIELPAGTLVAFSPYLIHHMPEYFPQPHRFDPDRWAGSPHSAFMPYGGGRRKCVGDTFGFTEAVIALATIATQWTLRHTPGTRPEPEVRFTITPANLRMEPRRRQD